MKDLLPHYEAELALLRRLCRGFAERYPAIAGGLMMAGDACKDPHVERLIQASALLAARISKRLDDDYALFTESLLEMLYPHYLRSFPSCAIVQLDFQSPAAELPDQVTLIPRGTVLKSPPVRGVKCRFRTSADIVVAPVKIDEVRFVSILNAPASIRLDADATSSIEISCTARSLLSAEKSWPPHRSSPCDGPVEMNHKMSKAACSCKFFCTGFAADLYQAASLSTPTTRTDAP